MKKLLLLLPILIFALTLTAQPPAGPADAGMGFGKTVTPTGAILADDLSAHLATKTIADVKVRGKVIEVCKAEGCWLKMETKSGPVMIKMKDHAFMVPLSMNGKEIVAEGTASFKETSVEMLQHYAEDAGKTKEEIAAIKTPKKEVSMQAVGIVVL